MAQKGALTPSVFGLTQVKAKGRPKGLRKHEVLVDYFRVVVTKITNFIVEAGRGSAQRKSKEWRSREGHSLREDGNSRTAVDVRNPRNLAIQDVANNPHYYLSKPKIHQQYDPL